MKLTLVQRIDYQVKCDKSIQFDATKREVVVKTTTTARAAAKYISEKGAKNTAQPFPKNRAESVLKAELLSLTEYLQQNPTYEKGRGGPYQPR